MRISIFGLGYVGTVAASCIADSGHEVITVDVDAVKVKCIAAGRAPLIEPGLSDLIAKGVKEGRLKATGDYVDAVMNSEISLICVGTPSHADGSLNLDYVVSACESIGAVLKNKKEYHIIILRSTVTPGSARNIAIPALEKTSGKKAGADFGFVSNPEFLREGAAIYDYFHPPKIVIGALDARAGQLTGELYEAIDAPIVFTSIETAEAVKYASNVWHALKIGFANELGNVLKEHGVDSHKVMDIFCMDTKLNISRAYLKPGFAFGGSCLPKDLRAIRACGRQKGIPTPIFDGLLEANDEQVRRAHEMVRQSGKRKIGLMGLAFKAGSDDLRESPLVKLADLLINDGMDLSIYDPHVSRAANMEGANQIYIREGIPHISGRLIDAPEDFLARAELFIIGSHGEDFSQILQKANDNAPIIDLVRLADGQSETRSAYQGICW